MERRALLADLALFAVLACAFTWTLDAPIDYAWVHHAQPPPWAIGCAALSAFGPTFGAAVVAWRRGALKGAFGPWRTAPKWLVLGFFLPLLLHLPATLIEVALGGHPARWFWWPENGDHVAALVVFALAEEPGWRGWAWPRVKQAFGPVAGALALGTVWGLWHLGMSFTPQGDWPTVGYVAFQVLELALWSVVVGWLVDRPGAGLLAAMAIHAGGHLDNVHRAPLTETRLWVLRFAVLGVAAIAAGWSLHRGRTDGPARARDAGWAG